MAWFRDADPLLQALAAGGFTWLLTAAGAGTVFLTRQVPAPSSGWRTTSCPTSTPACARGATMAGFSVMMVLDVALG